MPDLDAEIKAAEAQHQQSTQALDEARQRRQDDDRSLLAKVIIFAFVGLVTIVVVAAILGAYLFNWDALVEPGKYLASILGSVMLPVVTLVIGYYFGNR